MSNNADHYLNAKTMLAVGIAQAPAVGGVADQLKMLTVAVPRPGSNQVAVQLAASAMHIDEIYAAQGTALGRFYGPKNVSETNPHLLGSSVSGTIVALGEGVTGLSIGDEVLAIPSHHMETGPWAEYRCIDQEMVMLKPEGFTHVETAAATMASCVAWGAIGFSKTSPGDRCLVVGATGAVGIMIVQFLKSMNCHVTAVCSGPSADHARQYGANLCVDYTQDDFAEAARAAGISYDTVFDCVGGRDIEASAFRCLKPTGVFETVVGPMKYIGEKRLSWPEFIKVMGHICWRMASTRVFGGPRYTFGEKYPRLVIADAVKALVAHNIRMPIEQHVPFEIEAIQGAVRALSSHRAKGRMIIDFGLATA